MLINLTNFLPFNIKKFDAYESTCYIDVNSRFQYLIRVLKRTQILKNAFYNLLKSSKIIRKNIKRQEN